jgi:hypothetical protein
MAAALPLTQGVVLRIPDGSGGTNDVVVDACISEQHTLANTLTDHPVEQGFNVTDHSRPEPRKITLECYQSNTPLLGGADGTDYATQLWRQFVALHNSPQLIDVYTARDYYPQVGIESVTSPVDVKTANALKFTIALKEVRVVENKYTRVVFAKDPRAQKKTTTGTTTTTDTFPKPSMALSAGKFVGLLK